MSGNTHFDRMIHALASLAERVRHTRLGSWRSHWHWQTRHSYRFAHNATMSLVLFLITFLLMGIPVFASAGGPPIAQHVTVIHRNTHKGGSGINPVKHVNITFAGGSGILPVKHTSIQTKGGSGITPIKHTKTQVEGGSGINPVRRTPQGGSGINPIRHTPKGNGSRLPIK